MLSLRPTLSGLSSIALLALTGCGVPVLPPTEPLPPRDVIETQAFAAEVLTRTAPTGLDALLTQAIAAGTLSLGDPQWETRTGIHEQGPTTIGWMTLTVRDHRPAIDGASATRGHTAIVGVLYASHGPVDGVALWSNGLWAPDSIPFTSPPSTAMVLAGMNGPFPSLVEATQVRREGHLGVVGGTRDCPGAFMAFSEWCRERMTDGSVLLGLQATPNGRLIHLPTATRRLTGVSFLVR